MKKPFGNLDHRALTRFGMLSLLLFFLLNFILRRWIAAPWSGVLDGASGLALGCAVSFILVAARTKGRRLRGLEGEPCE